MHYDTVVETRVGTTITVKMQVSQDRPCSMPTPVRRSAPAPSSSTSRTSASWTTPRSSPSPLPRRGTWGQRSPSPSRTSNTTSSRGRQLLCHLHHRRRNVHHGQGRGHGGEPRGEQGLSGRDLRDELLQEGRGHSGESIALDTDLETWASASAWSLEDGEQVEITDVKYDFDPPRPSSRASTT